MCGQDVSKIAVYQEPAQGRFGVPKLTFRQSEKTIPVCLINTREVIRPKLYWDTQKAPYSGNLEYVLRSNDGHVYTAALIVDIARQHQRRSKRQQLAAYLIRDVDFVVAS